MSENNSHLVGNLEALLKSYEENPFLRAFIQLLPSLGGMADSLLTSALTSIRNERLETFFDELSRGNIELTKEVVLSEDFLHRFFITTKAALNTRRREKIRMFSRLLLSSVANIESTEEPDIYEDFMKMLDELSFRELRALSILNDFSDFPRSPSQNDLQWTSTFWDAFEARAAAELDLPREEVSDFMNRIARTGCYEMFTGGFMDYSGGLGVLTPTFRRFKSIVGIESASIRSNGGES